MHDLELADFALALLPKRKEEYQPKVKGKAVGRPVTIEVPYLPTSWRWYHASVHRRLTVLEGKKDAYGRFTEKPAIALAYDPDAILETDTYNCTRYFIEWDRGTEPVAGAKETRTILDKLRRAHGYFWEARAMERPGRHWAQRRSYYLDAFAGEELRRPKVLIVTRSAKRADNIWKLAVHFFRDVFTEGQLVDFLEVLTMEQALSKLRKIVRHAEASGAFAIWATHAHLSLASSLAAGGIVVALALGAAPWLGRVVGLVRRAPPRAQTALSRAQQHVGGPTARLLVLPMPSANAFAFHLTRTIGITQGALDQLDDDELGAILAHELGHLREPPTVVLLRTAVAAFVPVSLVIFPWVLGLRSDWGWLALWLFVIAVLLLYRRLQRALERRADTVGLAVSPTLQPRSRRCTERTSPRRYFGERQRTRTSSTGCSPRGRRRRGHALGRRLHFSRRLSSL